MFCLTRKGRQEKNGGKLLVFGCLKSKSYIKRFFSGPYLLCVRPKAVEPLLEELHEGICGSYTGGRSLSHRALTQGYWWPSMQKKAQEYVKKCDQCQKFALNIHQPRGVLNLLSSPQPFAQWSLDIVGLLTQNTRRMKKEGCRSHPLRIKYKTTTHLAALMRKWPWTVVAQLIFQGKAY